MSYNLLNTAMAATCILGCNKTFTFLKYLGTTIDDMGRDIPQFDEPKTLTGSIQAVSNEMYEQLGLDLNKNYKIVFSSTLMKSLAEDIQPDRIIYNNRTFELVENKNWYDTNGWTKALVVELKSLRAENESEISFLQNQKPDI